MAWEKRGNQLYYYQVTRGLDGRVKRCYLGKGERANEWSALLKRKAALTTKYRAERARLKQDTAEIEQAKSHRQTLALARLYLEAQGYHRPRRWKWRKKMAIDSTAQMVVAFQVPEEREARYALIDAGIAKGATPEQQEKAQACMKAHPEDVPNRWTRLTPTESIVVDAHHRADVECKALQAEQYAAELAGPNPSPIVLAMARQVVADLLYLNSQRLIFQKKLHSESGVPVKFLPIYDKPVELAHRRYLASSKMLTELKRLALPQVNVAMPGSVQVNAGINQINAAGAGALQVNR
jgi:hypothetical protein